MSQFVVYDTSTGAIERICGCANASEITLNAGTAVIAGAADDWLQYVLAGAVTDKPSIGAVISAVTAPADGVSSITISGLPNPTSAAISGPGVSSAITVTDGSLVLTFDTPGEYTVKLTKLNYLPTEYAINAT